jgi:hypothetical protein
MHYAWLIKFSMEEGTLVPSSTKLKETAMKNVLIMALVAFVLTSSVSFNALMVYDFVQVHGGVR